jgi:hypothetical protein
MKLLVCGSRTVKLSVDELEYYLKDLGIYDDCEEIISGAARGPDATAIKYARKNSVPLKIFKAEWEVYGNSAGVIRNRKMVDICDVCVAFWDMKSRGTKFTIDYARQKHKKVYVIDVIFED